VRRRGRRRDPRVRGRGRAARSRRGGLRWVLGLCGGWGGWDERSWRRGQRWDDRVGRYDEQRQRHVRQRWFRGNGRYRDQRCVGIGGGAGNRRNQRPKRDDGESSGWQCRQRRNDRDDGRDGSWGEVRGRLRCRWGRPQGHALGRDVGTRRGGGRKASAPCQQQRWLVMIR